MNFAEDIISNIGMQTMLLGIVGAGVTVFYAVSLLVSATVARRNFVRFETR